MAGVFRETVGLNYDFNNSLDISTSAGYLWLSVDGNKNAFIGTNFGIMSYSQNYTSFTYIIPNISSSHGGFYFDYSNANATADFHGGDYGDVLVGGAFADQLYGNGGADKLDGRGGADTMVGGAGDDTFHVDDTADVVTENTSEGTDTIYASVDYAISLEVETMILQGAAKSATGNDASNTLIGNSLANRILGRGGDDALFGGDGSDMIYGGTGNDVIRGEDGEDKLFGNTGADTFVFGDGETAASRRKADIIMSFSGAQGDRVDLSNIDADENTADTQQFDFIGRHNFSHQAGELRYVIDNKDIYIEGDTDGNGRADLVIHLVGAHELKAGYILL